MGGGLKFNQELCVFEEDEDPLQNSLHLEDLPNLAASLNYDLHSETSCGSDNSTASCSSRHHSHIRALALNLGFLMPEDDIDGVTKLTTGSFGTNGNQVVTDDASIVSSELNILPKPPSFDEGYFGVPDTCNSLSQPHPQNCSSSLIQRPNTSEILKQLEEEEHKQKQNHNHNVQNHKLYRSSLSLYLSKNNRNERYTGIDHRDEMEEQGQDYIHKNASRDHSESCSYSMPQLKSSNSGDDTIMSTVSGKSYRITKGLKKTSTGCTNININTNISTSTNVSVGFDKKKLLDSDSASCISSASSLSTRITKAITPRWMKKRQEKNREKKNALTRARDLMVLRNGQTQNTFNDDDSIVTSVQIRNESTEDAIIENMDKLNLLSSQSTHAGVKKYSPAETHFLNDSLLDSSESSVSTKKSTTITSIKATSKWKTLVIARPHALTLEDRMQSAPVMKSPRPANLTMKKRSKSDSPVVVARKSLMYGHMSRSEMRMSEGQKGVISVSPRSASLSKSSRFFFKRSRSNKGQTSRLKIGRSGSPKAKARSERNKTTGSRADTGGNQVPYPAVHFDQNSSFNRSIGNRSIDIFQEDDTVSCISIESSLGSTMSGAQTPVKSRSSHQLMAPKTPTRTGASASRSLVGSPASLGRSRSDQSGSKASMQSPSILRRTQSLQPPIPQLNHLSHLSTSLHPLNSVDGTQYASHLLGTPSSHSSHLSRTPTASRSLSSYLESPSRISSNHGSQNDACSVASGISFASTYTALSNLSYKDPCAKPSKTMKRSNLDVSGDGDGDIWVEKIFVSRRSGKQRIFFVSVATGRRVRDEPPTGASKVLYQDDLQELRKIEAEEEAMRLNTPTMYGTMASC